MRRSLCCAAAFMSANRFDLSRAKSMAHEWQQNQPAGVFIPSLAGLYSAHHLHFLVLFAIYRPPVNNNRAGKQIPSLTVPHSDIPLIELASVHLVVPLVANHVDAWLRRIMFAWSILHVSPAS